MFSSSPCAVLKSLRFINKLCAGLVIKSHFQQLTTVVFNEGWHSDHLCLGSYEMVMTVFFSRVESLCEVSVKVDQLIIIPSPLKF